MPYTNVSHGRVSFTGRATRGEYTGARNNLLTAMLSGRSLRVGLEHFSVRKRAKQNRLFRFLLCRHAFDQSLVDFDGNNVLWLTQMEVNWNVFQGGRGGIIIDLNEEYFRFILFNVKTIRSVRKKIIITVLVADLNGMIIENGKKLTAGNCKFKLVNEKMKK